MFYFYFSFAIHNTKNAQTQSEQTLTDIDRTHSIWTAQCHPHTYGCHKSTSWYKLHHPCSNSELFLSTSVMTNTSRSPWQKQKLSLNRSIWVLVQGNTSAINNTWEPSHHVTPTITWFMMMTPEKKVLRYTCVTLSESMQRLYLNIFLVFHAIS